MGFEEQARWEGVIGGCEEIFGARYQNGLGELGRSGLIAGVDEFVAEQAGKLLMDDEEGRELAGRLKRDFALVPSREMVEARHDYLIRYENGEQSGLFFVAGWNLSQLRNLAYKTYPLVEATRGGIELVASEDLTRSKGWSLVRREEGI